MRKDLKKRLEKALITLQEPGGSTIRSIVKVINHDPPVLSLRKVLEALQDGINEGFLCMYNGRFKLRQQLYPGKEADVFEKSENAKREKKKKDTTPESHLPEYESDDELEDEEEEKEEEEEDDDDDDDDDEDDENNDIMFTLATSKPTINDSNLIEASEKRPRKPQIRTKKSRVRQQKIPGKGRLSGKKAKGKPAKKQRRKSKLREPKCNECLLLVDSSSTIPEAKSSKPTSERPDVKRQRGPRCTSMKKDVRMPSKVHIPFVSPSVPQKGNFNDLVRRSPDPVNGPLFDDYHVGLGMFESFC